MTKLLTLPLLLTFAALPVWADPTPSAPAPKPAVPRQAIMDTADHSGGWVGKTAQAFTRTDSDGKTVDLSKVFGTRPVVLIIYRGVWCPYCHSQMADLSRHQAEFQRAGAAVYAVSNEDAPKLKQMQSSEHLEFVTFLSDPDGSAAKLYAGLYPGSMVHQPGSFVINKRRKITYAYVNQDFHSRAATTSLLKAVWKSR